MFFFFFCTIQYHKTKMRINRNKGEIANAYNLNKNNINDNKQFATHKAWCVHKNTQRCLIFIFWNFLFYICLFALYFSFPFYLFIQKKGSQFVNYQKQFTTVMLTIITGKMVLRFVIVFVDLSQFFYYCFHVSYEIEGTIFKQNNFFIIQYKVIYFFF